MNVDEPGTVDPADLIAEPDDEPDLALIEDDEDDDADIYFGPALGGPWNGRLAAASRYPSGFLLVDMPERQVWIYDRGADGVFRARSDIPEPLSDEKRWHAAEREEYDILVPDMADDGVTS